MTVLSDWTTASSFKSKTLLSRIRIAKSCFDKSEFFFPPLVFPFVLRPANTLHVSPRERPHYAFGGVQGPRNYPSTRCLHGAALIRMGSDFWLRVLGLCTYPGPPEAKGPKKAEEKNLKSQTIYRTFCSGAVDQLCFTVVKPREKTVALSFLPGPASGLPESCLLPRCAFLCWIFPTSGTMQLGNSTWCGAGFVNLTASGLRIRLKQCPGLQSISKLKLSY